MTSAISNSIQPTNTCQFDQIRQSCDCYLTQKISQVFKQYVIENKYFHMFALEAFRGFLFTSGAIIALIMHGYAIKEVFFKATRGG